MCMGKGIPRKVFKIFFTFVLDKMGKKHHIGGASRILTFLVVVSIFLFRFFS